MSRKKSILNILSNVVEKGIEKGIEKLPSTVLKNWNKKRKADQAYAHAQERYKKEMERKDQLIEKAALQNIKTQKQIELADMRMEKERLKLEKLKSKR